MLVENYNQYPTQLMSVPSVEAISACSHSCLNTPELSQKLIAYTTIIVFPLCFAQYCMNYNQGEGELQGTLLSRSWSPTDSFPQALPLPSLDHNPSYPGDGPLSPQHPASGITEH